MTNFLSNMTQVGDESAATTETADLMRENIRYARRLANQRGLLHQDLAGNLRLLDELAEARYRFNRSLDHDLPNAETQVQQTFAVVRNLQMTATELNEKIAMACGAMAQLKLALCKIDGTDAVTNSHQEERVQWEELLQRNHIPSPPLTSTSSPTHIDIVGAHRPSPPKHTPIKLQSERPRRSSSMKISSFTEPSLRNKLRKGDPFTFEK